MSRPWLPSRAWGLQIIITRNLTIFSRKRSIISDVMHFFSNEPAFICIPLLCKNASACPWDRSTNGIDRKYYWPWRGNKKLSRAGDSSRTRPRRELCRVGTKKDTKRSVSLFGKSIFFFLANLPFCMRTAGTQLAFEWALRMIYWSTVR